MRSKYVCFTSKSNVSKNILYRLNELEGKRIMIKSIKLPLELVLLLSEKGISGYVYFQHIDRLYTEENKLPAEAFDIARKYSITGRVYIPLLNENQLKILTLLNENTIELLKSNNLSFTFGKIKLKEFFSMKFRSLHDNRIGYDIKELSEEWAKKYHCSANYIFKVWKYGDWMEKE